MRRINILFVLLLTVSTARAYDIKFNGIYYDVVPKAKMAKVVIGDDHYRGEVTIPETIVYEGVTCSVTSMANAVFKDCDVTKVWLPDGITEISYTAFENCYNLISVRLPANLERISTRAFDHCESLQVIEFPSSLKEIEYRAFWRCLKIPSIMLPDGLETLGEGAFYDCPGVISVHLPRSLSVIPKDAFYNCKFEAVDIHDGIKEIRDRAFCSTGLKTIVIPETVRELGSEVFMSCADLVSVQLPNNMTELPTGIFRGCKNLKTIHIPEGVTTIGQYAFAETGFDNIDMIPQGVKYLNYAFMNCPNMTTVTIPEGTEFISYGEFMGCENLHTIILPASVKEILGQAFGNCTSLQEIRFEHITSIGYEAFLHCNSFTSLELPLVEELGISAFKGCSNLKNVVLGRNMKKFIGYSVFEQCKSLEDFYCYAEVLPEIPEGDKYTIFRDSYVNYATLHVPAAAIEAYRSTSPWSDFGSIVPIETGVEQVASDKSQVTSEEWYTLEGIRVAQPRKGVYIHNGKVVVIK